MINIANNQLQLVNLFQGTTREQGGKEQAEGSIFNFPFSIVNIMLTSCILY